MFYTQIEDNLVTARRRSRDNFILPSKLEKKRFSHPILRMRELVALLLDAWPFQKKYIKVAAISSAGQENGWGRQKEERLG